MKNSEYTLANPGEIEALKKLILDIKFFHDKPELSKYATSETIAKLIVILNDISFQNAKNILQKDLNRNLYIDNNEEMISAIKRQISYLKNWYTYDQIIRKEFLEVIIAPFKLKEETINILIQD
ncbi:MAG: hypothetical protein GY827_05080 [Cytophagales bacterium]|nr:hypothetical protein [Cytophagales bacterium]